MKLFSNTISTIENALNYSSQKQKVISQNIANVDTPNYKAKNVRFNDALHTAMNQSFTANRTDARHIAFEATSSNNGSTIVSQNSGSYNENGNSVDIDKEMSDLATNQIYYNAMIDRMSGKFSSLERVIRGGK